MEKEGVKLSDSVELRLYNAQGKLIVTSGTRKSSFLRRLFDYLSARIEVRIL